jgi:alkanesulfonate monooxygenase SsuD/methylene tetrahydromethanopterin reductase-like flavin-dependent oxidoreductase (luciferase family)
VITAGKLIVGIGQGYRDVEFAAFGIRKEDRRNRYLSHYEVVRKLLAGEAVSFSSETTALNNARLTTLPVQSGGPKFWMGASTESALARAASLADGWVTNPAADAGTIAEQAASYRVAARNANRKPQIAVFREVFCARTRDEAIEVAGPYLVKKYGAYEAWGQGKVVGGHGHFASDAACFPESRFLLGSPEECTAHLQWWREVVGADYFLVRSEWAGLPVDSAIQSLTLLTREVLPNLLRDGAEERGTHPRDD